jgi:hypothetical protein
LFHLNETVSFWHLRFELDLILLFQFQSSTFQFIQLHP